MKPFLPKRTEPFVFGLLVSGMMTFFVSGISTVLAAGFAPGLLGKWMAAWAASWVIAFPILLFVVPVVRRIIHSLVITDGS